MDFRGLGGWWVTNAIALVRLSSPKNGSSESPSDAPEVAQARPFSLVTTAYPPYSTSVAKREPIPKGLHLSAQGCARRATLGV